MQITQEKIGTRALHCWSWLLDPALEKFLGTESRIVRFAARFTVVPVLSAGRDVFSFVFPSSIKNLKGSAGKLPAGAGTEKALLIRRLHLLLFRDLFRRRAKRKQGTDDTETLQSNAVPPCFVNALYSNLLFADAACGMGGFLFEIRLTRGE